VPEPAAYKGAARALNINAIILYLAGRLHFRSARGGRRIR